MTKIIYCECGFANGLGDTCICGPASPAPQIGGAMAQCPANNVGGVCRCKYPYEGTRIVGEPNKCERCWGVIPSPAPQKVSFSSPSLDWIAANEKFVEDMVSIEESEDIPDLAKVLDAYFTHRLSALSGLGKEAAEKMVAECMSGESDAYLKHAVKQIAAIIDSLVSERLKQ